MPFARRIRVALVVYRDDPSAGGSLRVAETLAQHLPRDHVDAHLVLAYGSPGAVAGRVGVPTHALQAPTAAHLPSWRRTREWFRAKDFDLIHFIDQVYWLYLATVGLSARRVVHFHGRPVLAACSWQHRLLASLHRHATDAAIAISHGARRAVARAGWLPRARLHVVHNAVNVHYFGHLPSRTDARTALGLPQDAVLFGMVARLAQGNACLEIFDVLRHVPESWQAVLVGDGPLRPVLSERARELGLTHRVHLPGPLSDVRPAYAALDVVVLLSRYQPFCLMLAEAMACGVPVVGLQGAGEYAEPEYPLITTENAVFFPRRHPEDFASQEPDEHYAKLAQAMVNLHEDKVSRQHQVEHARQWVTERFSGESQGRACLDVYRRIVAGDSACG